jgi:hypothetical protein
MFSPKKLQNLQPNRSEPSLPTKNALFGPPNDGFPYKDVYMPLKGSDESRLIHLLPGLAEDPIQCNLVNNVNFRADKLPEITFDDRVSAFDMSEFLADPLLATCILVNEHNAYASEALQVNYEAVSYCAGDPKQYNTISVNGYKFNVFRNLFTAMTEFRHPTEPRVLWVDQICINQTDLEERGKQVLLMKDIYENASSVRVWLGGESSEPEDISSDLTFVLLEAFLCENRTRLQKCISQFASGDTDKSLWLGRWLKDLQVNFHDVELERNDPNLMAALKWMRYNILDPSNALLWLSFGFFLDRPWWRRSWVFQEVVVSRKATLHCGSRTIDWDDFALALIATFNMLRITVDDERSDLLFLKITNHLIMNIRQPYLMVSSRIGFDYPKMSLLGLLRSIQNAKATDPRDKVYSILALLGRKKTEKLGLVPEYAASNTVADVFTQATKACIESSEELDILSDTYGSIEENPHNLPSWVPDWTRISEYIMSKTPLIPKLYGFTATGTPSMSSSAEVTYSQDGRAILLRAISLGRVSALGLVDDELDTHTQENTNRIVSTLTSWKVLAYLRSSADMEDFCQTVSLEQSSAPPEWWKKDVFNVWANRLVEQSRRTGRGRPYYRRRFCRLDLRGRMGMLPAGASVGDVVCAAWGSSVPFVLKPIGDGYQLVGEAYVNGVMHGELVRDMNQAWRESIQFKIV